MSIKVCQVASGSSITECTDMLAPHGDYEVSRDCDDTTDIIIGWSVTTMPMTLKAFDMFPQARRVAYNWDVYGWIWETPREGEYDYHEYGRMLSMCDEVWCPSECTVERMKQWYGLDGVVIKSAIPYFKEIDDKIRDDGYAYTAMRKLPDKNENLFDDVCEELGIPYKVSTHDKELWEFREELAGCRLNVAHYHEASTGGLALLEGYYLGKPVLLSDSKWMGGRDYMGDRATYFKWNDREDFKKKLYAMYENPPKIDLEEARTWVEKHYSRKEMGRRLHERIQAVLSLNSDRPRGRRAMQKVGRAEHAEGIWTN